MIVERYDQVNLLALLPEYLRHHDPVLEQMDTLLDDDALFRQVKADLCQRYPQSATKGRPSTPVEVTMRMLLLRRLKNWSYADTVWSVADSLTLRQFCRVGGHRIPNRSTLIRWEQCIRPETLQTINARVVALARARGVTYGQKLRLDTTVVETTIHYPSDSSLLADGVRVLSRLVGKARGQITGPAELFRSRVRSAKRRARQIGESTRKRGETAVEQRQKAYRRLLGIARAMVRQSQEVIERLGGAVDDRLRQELNQFTTRTKQVISQTQRRLAGETVPAGDKLVSIFEEHTAIIRRDKPRATTEFGHKVLLGEVENGIIAQYATLEGNAADVTELEPSVARHREQFGRPPKLVATDRGFWRADCEDQLHEAGVTQVAIPRPGKVTPERRAHEREPWFRRAQRFRAGGEGRISVCKRRGHLGRCRDHGADGFDRWVGWGVMANNLRSIADHALAATAA